MNNTFINNKKNEIYEKKHTFKYNIRNQEAMLIQLRNLISNKTKIDKKIIYNLLKMERIQNISNITIKNKKLDRIIEIPDKIILKENYQLHTDYIFANFIIFNNNYEIKENFYINKLDKKINLHSSQFNFIICNGRSYNAGNYRSGLYLNFILNKQDLSYSNINLLNKTEKKELDRKLISNLVSINKMKNINNNIQVLYDKDNYKFQIYLESNLNVDLDKINLIINQEIKSITDCVENCVEEIKEKNKSIFERALLEQEITNF